MIDFEKLFALLLIFVDQCGTQKAAAQRLNITPQYLSDILKRRRAISPVVARALGYRPLTVYVPITEAAP